jgi:hypothetical protein
MGAVQKRCELPAPAELAAQVSVASPDRTSVVHIYAWGPREEVEAA